MKKHNVEGIVFALFLLIILGAGLARCAAYDWDWRCAVAQCRIEKAGDK